MLRIKTNLKEAGFEELYLMMDPNAIEHLGFDIDCGGKYGDWLTFQKNNPDWTAFNAVREPHRKAYAAFVAAAAPEEGEPDRRGAVPKPNYDGFEAAPKQFIYDGRISFVTSCEKGGEPQGYLQFDGFSDLRDNTIPLEKIAESLKDSNGEAFSPAAKEILKTIETLIFVKINFPEAIATMLPHELEMKIANTLNMNLETKNTLHALEILQPEPVI